MAALILLTLPRMISLRRTPRAAVWLISLLLLSPASWAAITLQIGQNLTGSKLGVDSDALPYDGNGAVGPQHFVELINGRFSVYTKSTGTRAKTLLDLTFWSQAGVTIGNNLDVTDPRIVFDAETQRWFASCIDISATGEHQARNRFLLAVSSSADPTGSWHAFAFTADPVNGDFADFPTLGLDQAAVYLGGDLYTPLTGLHIGSTLVSIPKADLLAAVPTVSNRTSYGTLAFNAHGQVLQPAMATGKPTSGEAVLAVGDLGISGRPSTKLFLTTLQGNTATNFVVITVPTYSIPPAMAQPDGTTNLDTGDARFSAVVRRVDDVLYAVHCVANAPHTALRWYRIDAVKMALIESGTITDPNLDLAYPSIAANQSGTVVVACNGSSEKTYVSCYAVGGQIQNGTLVFGDLLLLKAGLASYQAPDDTGRSRWGDYSATTVDPVDPTRFWTIQAYPTDDITWATQITELITAPHLTIAADGANVVIAWPASAGNAQLQSTTALAPTTQWSPVSQTPTVINGQATVQVPISGVQSYFRLVQ